MDMASRQETSVALVRFHAETLSITGQITCGNLLSRGVELAHFLGYRADGIVKGSKAAKVMSTEAKYYEGKVPSVEEGGLSASLQSIGASGIIKPRPQENIRSFLRQAGLLQSGDQLICDGSEDQTVTVQLPRYWKAATTSSVPSLVNDYRVNGHNFHMVTMMLNESILSFCRNNLTPCNMNSLSSFKVSALERIENIEAFKRHKKQESSIARSLENHPQQNHHETDQLPTWLKKLSMKNGLNPSANCVYLLHGTKEDNLDCIVAQGLKTKFSLLGNTLSYGRGLYFTDCACKASQYGNIIIVCRVALGKQEVLPGTCPNKLFPSFGCHSAMAKRNVTKAPHGQPQVHNEHIVYDESSCYPEFVIRFEKS